MKAKYTIAVVIATGLALFSAIQLTRASNVAPNVTPTITTSRYVMFGGTFNVDSELRNGAPVTENGVFKMDTYTGQVWILRSGKLQNGTRVEKWEPIAGKPAGQMPSTPAAISGKID